MGHDAGVEVEGGGLQDLAVTAVHLAARAARIVAAGLVRTRPPRLRFVAENDPHVALAEHAQVVSL